MQELKMVSIEDIDLPPTSLRTDVSKESLLELAESLETEGLIQPIVVRPKEGRYEVVAGERRVRAAIYANIPKIPAIVRDVKDEEANRIRLIENINRSDLEIWERADGIKFHMEMYGLTLEQMAKILHKKPETLQNWFKLASSTSPRIRSSSELRKLPPAYLMLLTKYDDETQERFAQAIYSNKLGKYQISKLIDLFDQDPRADINELARRLKEGYVEVVTLVPKQEAEKIKRKRVRERKEAKKKVRAEELKPYLRPREKTKEEKLEEKSEEEKVPAVVVPPKELEELNIPFTTKERIMKLTELPDVQVRMGKAIVDHKFDLRETTLFLDRFKERYPEKTLEDIIEETKAESKEWMMAQPLIITLKSDLYESLERYYKKMNKDVKKVTPDNIKGVIIEWLNEHANKCLRGAY